MGQNTTLKRLVIKIGTSTITDAYGKLDLDFIDSIVDQLYKIRESGVEICLITSGSVACGKVLLHNYPGTSNLSKQVLATRGQAMLMHTWSKSFDRYGIHTFQFLLTQNNLEHPALPLRACMEIGVPVINFNDAVSMEEIKQVKKDADNDDIAACVARLTAADVTVFLTQSDGVLNKNNQTINMLYLQDEEQIPYNGISNGGTGGMSSKVTFARTIAQAGGVVFIVNGKTNDVLTKIVAGEHLGTKVVAKKP